MTSAPYQDAILAHARSPHNLGALMPFDARGDEVNRLCGDEVTVYLRHDPTGMATGFTAKGCALCRASASVLMLLSASRTNAEISRLVDAFIPAFADLDAPIDELVPRGTELLFSLKPFAARTKCVLLPWQAMATALAALKHAPLA